MLRDFKSKETKMLKISNLFFLLGLFFVSHSVNALPLIIINESFDPDTQMGSYSVVNNSGENIDFLAVGHTESWDAQTSRLWGAITVSKVDWNNGIDQLIGDIGIDTREYNFDDYFSGASYANVYFNQPIYIASDEVDPNLEDIIDEPFFGMIIPEEFSIKSGETTGFQFSYGALEPDSNFVSIGSSGTAYTGSANVIANVPVPAAVWLFSSGLIGLLVYRRPNI